MTTDLISRAIINRFKPIAMRTRTLTYDNRKNFGDIATIDKASGSISYFTDPNSSWQSGSKETLDGLIIRQYNQKSRPQ